MSKLYFDRICMIGLGYIGLPTAAMFASRNVQVLGVDVSEEVVDTINRGKIHIVEPDLDTVVKNTVASGLLKAALAPEEADAFLIAVPTPFKGDEHAPDLGFIEAAANSIAPVLKSGDLVVLESTSPVGTTEDLARWLERARPDLSVPQTAGEASDVRIAYCPERVLPGKVMQELLINDRIIGGITPACSEAAKTLYNVFVEGDCLVTNARTAEMCKLTENSFRDVNIAFANELSVICDKIGIDVWELIGLANRHPRVDILEPGPGVGGHCIAVDPWFIVNKTPDLSRLIEMARLVNDAKPDWVISKVNEAVETYLMTNADAKADEISFAIYGLSFKPDVDDLRSSPALEIARRMATELPGKIMAVEPNILEAPFGLENVELVTFDRALAADIHIMLVDHKSFYGQVKPEGEIVDLRGVWR
jgi:UDP-N-acetyl-D-mannosaminuronic acid dehydrogenase